MSVMLMSLTKIGLALAALALILAPAAAADGPGEPDAQAEPHQIEVCVDASALWGDPTGVVYIGDEDCT